MAPVFIFARHIEEVIREGKKEIEIPKGARISAAALDIIKYNQIQVRYVIPQVKPQGAAPQPDHKPTDEIHTDVEETQEETTHEQDEGRSASGTVGEISDNDLEEITKRVIKRFREIKGQKSSSQVEEGAGLADDDDLVICRCEEITKGEIKEAIRNGMKTLNGVKRVTRAGMGLCQGQTCERLVTQILAGELGLNPADLEPITARAPVRPLRLSVFSTG